MNLTLPFHEGDSTLRGAPRILTTEAPAASFSLAAVTVLRAIGRGLRRLEGAVADSRRRRIEAYLARSTDLVDLEHRMRSIERREVTPL